MPPAITNYVDETQCDVEIPETIIQALNGRENNCLFLPNEGHFLVDINIHVDPSNHNGTTINVHITCYRHSARGGKAIEKIRSSLEAEVLRTNRKWRKIRQRQQLQQQQQR
jgi:hypothetical protein